MTLPNPDYLAPAYFNWNGNQFDAALIGITPTGSPAIATGRRDIRWDALNNTDKQVVHDLIMGYALRGGLTEATALTGFVPVEAYQVIDYRGTLVGGNIAGLEDGKVYTASVVSDGTTYPISIVGATTDTVTNVLAKINADLTGVAFVINAGGDLEIPTSAAGAGKVVEAFDQNLFRSMTGFIIINEKRVGVDNIADVFDLNFRDGYQSYAELLIGALRVIPNKTPKNPATDQDIYFNHSTAAWTYIHSDVAV